MTDRDTVSRLVTYASPAFEVRRRILHLSARFAADIRQTSAWNNSRVQEAGFSSLCPNISLTERGGGWWAWKPFVISQELETMPAGEWLLYCDVGRNHPFKVFDRPLCRLISWARAHSQFCLPGVLIPWCGPMSRWTKRDAFTLTDSDWPEIHSSIPIQASFSLWQSGPESRAFVRQWMDWCSDRRLVSDDANTLPLNNLPDFVEHRHDQSLLSLLCFKRGVQGLSLGTQAPLFDEKNPCAAAGHLGEAQDGSITTALLLGISNLLGIAERQPRTLLSKSGFFGKRAA